MAITKIDGLRQIQDNTRRHDLPGKFQIDDRDRNEGSWVSSSRLVAVPAGWGSGQDILSVD